MTRADGRRPGPGKKKKPEAFYDLCRRPTAWAHVITLLAPMPMISSLRFITVISYTFLYRGGVYSS